LSVKCPTCGTAISVDNVPESHKQVVANTKLSYPWYERLTPKCVDVGREIDPPNIQTFWIFTWDEPEKQVHDVAAIGTLRVSGDTWSWEFARMDGEGGEQLGVEVYGTKYPDFFKTDSALGYRCVSGKIV